MEDEICPYATFHLLGFREEMDPSKAMQFQTFPHPGNGHSGTMGPPVGHPTNASAHSRSGSQSMVSRLPPLHTRSRCIPDFVLHASQPRQNGRYSRVPSQGGGSGTHNVFSPEYDDPANCAPEEDQYGSQYGQYGAPYDHYGSRGSVGRRSVGSARNIPVSGSPEPPPPPPRNHDQNNSSFNDSKESNEISEAECDRDQLVNRNYGGQYETPVFESGGGSLERNESNLSLLWKGAKRERRRDLTFRGYVSPSGFPARVLVLSLRSRKYIGMPDESRRRTTRPGFCVSL